MARNQSDGWGLVGGLLTLGAAAGAAYLVTSQIEQWVDELVKQPVEQALRDIAGRVATMSDDGWDLLRSAIARRARASNRAAELLAALDHTRQIGPHMLRLVELPEREGIRLINELSDELDDEAWKVVCIVLRGLSDDYPRASTLQTRGLHTRALLRRADQILANWPEGQRLAVGRAATDLPSHEFDELLVALSWRAEQRRDARALLPFARCVADARALVVRLLMMPTGATRSQLEHLAVKLEPMAWEAVIAVLIAAAHIKTEAAPILAEAQAVDAALSDVNRVMSMPLSSGYEVVERLAGKLAPEAWCGLRTLLALRAERDEKAQRLLDSAEAARRELEEPPLLLPPSAVTGQTTLLVDATPEEPAPAPQAPEQAPFSLEIFRHSLRTALADRVITPEEGAMLEQLRLKLNITDDLARHVFQEVRAEAM